MSKGLTINEDVWDLIEDLDNKELKNLVSCLAAFSRGDCVPERMRTVKGVFNRIALDNGREDDGISEIRRQAAFKRWHKTNDSSIQTDAKVYANDANHANDAKQICINKEREEKEESSKEVREDKENRDFNINNNNNLSSSTNNRFNPPTVDDIKAYATEKGYKNFNAEQFWNFYESKNWMVGKNKMTNWHSAVSGWALRDKEKVIESAKPITDYKSQLQKYDYATLLRK